jgi:hypothetical protein
MNDSHNQKPSGGHRKCPRSLICCSWQLKCYLWATNQRANITRLTGTFSETCRDKVAWHNDDECLLRRIMEQPLWSISLGKKFNKSTYLRTVMCLQAFLAALSWANSYEDLKSLRRRSCFNMPIWDADGDSYVQRMSSALTSCPSLSLQPSFVTRAIRVKVAANISRSM